MIETDAIRDDPAETKATNVSDVASVWRPTLIVTALCACALILVYGDTFRSMASVWWHSQTFAHGLFILPISLYLVWEERESLQVLAPRAEVKALFGVALFGLGWLAARLANVLVVEQYCAIASLIAVLCAVLGPTVSRRIAFPLGFLLFAVPVGEALVPTLIDYTTSVSVAAIRITGIPVLRNGNTLVLPNGVWSVVEACSGLRYLIACVTIGLPFAYLMYSSWKRRAAFVAMSVVVPVLANWLRVYIVILIGYWSDMRLAVGLDHAVYGWFIYAFIMFVLLWAGSLFREPSRQTEAPTATRSAAGVGRGRMILVGMGAVVCAALFPLWDAHAENAAGEPRVDVHLDLSTSLSGFTAAEPRGVLRWQPVYQKPDATVARTYESDEGTVGLHVALYRHQRQGAELVSSTNEIVHPGDEVWKQLSAARGRAGPVSFDEWLLGSPEGKLLVWRWYWVAGKLTASDVEAKMLEGWRKLQGKPTPEAGIVVMTDVGNGLDAARRRLESFVITVQPELEARLAEAGR